MTDSTTPHSDAAMPPASAGSVDAPVAWDGVPIAWAAVAKNGQPLWLAYNKCDAEGAVVGMAEAVPLYRSPTLTDAERTMLVEYRCTLDPEDYEQLIGVIDGLLERLG